MIAKLTSKKEVVIDTFDNTTAYPSCEIITFTKLEGKYSINGRYYVSEIVDEVETKTTIRSFSLEYTNAQIDGLFNSLNITYPDGISFSERDTINVAAGLKAVVGSENRWGLSLNDWE